MDENLDRLIGEYAEGRISPEDRAKLEALMAADPELATFVREVQQGFAIEDYASGRMSGEALAAFERRLAEDADLREALEEYRTTQRVLALDRHRRTTENLEAIGREVGKRKKNGRGPWWWVGAFALVAVGLGIWFSLPDNSPAQSNPESPAESKGSDSPAPAAEPSAPTNPRPPAGESETNIQEPPIANTPLPQEFLLAVNELKEEKFDFAREGVKGNDFSDSLYKQWYPAYLADDYPKVINSLEPHVESLRSDREGQALLALGLSYFYRSDCGRAIGVFDQMLTLPLRQWNEHARWYKVLCLYQSKDGFAAAEAIIRNDILSAKSHEHKSDARRLLDLLQ